MKIIFYLFIFAIFLLENTISVDIKTISPCIAELSDGRRIDLTSLAVKNSYKWKKKASNPPGDSHWYYYNPCKPFNLDVYCPDNAVCQGTSDEKVFYDLGRQDSTVQFKYENGLTAILYSGQTKDRSTVVGCFCSKSTEPTFEVQGSQFEGGLTIYYMTLNSTCCCPNGCINKSILSAGSILLIIALAVILIYIFSGMIINCTKSRKLNVESIPHIEFWREQPQNIKTGFSFVFGKLTPKKSGYSNI